jgi:membrane-bound ClpP family serine protease
LAECGCGRCGGGQIRTDHIENIGSICNIIMVWSMRAKAKSGVAAMIGRTALVIEDIAPEGKVRVWGEIWTATGRNKRIAVGKEVKILDAKGLVLTVDALDEDHEG